MAQSAFSAPVSPLFYPHLSLILTFVGILSLVYFLAYELSSKKRSIVKEIGIALVGSFFLGFGTLFFLLWSGVYV